MLRARLLIGVSLFLSAASAQAATVENIRIWSDDGRTRVVLDLSSAAQHKIFTLRAPDRIVVDLADSRLGRRLDDMPKGSGTVKAIRTGLRANGDLRVVLDLSNTVRSRSFTAGPNDQYGDRLVIDLQRESGPRTVKRASESYQRGRDIIVAVDPGHGGHDPGAIGRAKTREKDIALQISKRLARELAAEPGMRPVLIRNADYYVDHRERMSIARRNKADIFVSIHADAVDDRRARGATVYVLSLKGASDEAAMRLAQRENGSGVVGDISLADKDPVLASVLLDLSQNASLSASLDAGAAVIRELGRVGSVRRYEVQQAGFVMLKSPDIPSILVETNYISNPTEEKKLRDKKQQQQIARAILSGLRKYFYENPPPDSQIAMNLKRSPDKQVRHVIARGDTLSEIAERYNVSMSAIRAANRMTGDSVKIGQTLQIPVFSGT